MTSLLLSYFVHNAQNQSANISAFHDCTFTMKRRSTCDKFIALKLLEKLYNIAILFSLVYNKIKMVEACCQTYFQAFSSLCSLCEEANRDRTPDLRKAQYIPQEPKPANATALSSSQIVPMMPRGLKNVNA